VHTFLHGFLLSAGQYSEGLGSFASQYPSEFLFLFNNTLRGSSFSVNQYPSEFPASLALGRFSGADSSACPQVGLELLATFGSATSFAPAKAGGQVETPLLRAGFACHTAFLRQGRFT